MLSFFRQIRQRLLPDNKVSKYLLYAIGEILLVMIGILLALQVNNWNEERIERKKERFYLNALKEEFENNKQEVERVKALNSQNLEHALALSARMGKNATIPEKTFDSLIIGAVGSEVQYRPAEGVMRELIQSGNLGILSNNLLRKKLSSWDGLITRVRFQEEEHARPRVALFEFVEQAGNTRKSILNAFGGFAGLGPNDFEISSNHLINNLKFDNYLTGFIATSLFLNNGYYSRLEDEINQTHTLIEQELKKGEGR
ncbi:DUF6090 family protein [Robiginitalea sp. IMCC44478]|uniref:DUF6090 family protein n=1 Tax=Robiginitalea sp. IMCC44478 TaxID=3459122 RepID=UPI004042D57A